MRPKSLVRVTWFLQSYMYFQSLASKGLKSSSGLWCVSFALKSQNFQVHSEIHHQKAPPEVETQTQKLRGTSVSPGSKSNMAALCINNELHITLFISQ